MYRGWLPIADPEKKYRYGERERLPPPPSPPPCITVFRLAAPRPCVFCIFFLLLSPPLPCFASTQSKFSTFLPFFFWGGGGCEGFDSEDENFWEKNYVTWRVVQFRRVYDFVCNRWSSETIVIRRACGFEAKVHWL